MEQKNMQQYFGETSFLQNFSDQAMQKLYIHSSFSQFPIHTVLTPGDRLPEHHIHFIKKGIIKIQQIHKTRKKEYMIGFLKEHDFFTDFIFDQESRFELENLKPSEIISIPLNVFCQTLTEDPKLIKKFIHSSSQKIYCLLDLLFFHIFSTSNGKVAATLLEMAELFGRRYHDYIMIQKDLTHRDLASFLGTSREAITKIMNILKKNQLISYMEKKVIILDEKRLKEWAYQ